MKVCASCQTENPDSAKFCRKCGTPFAKQGQDAQQAEQPQGQVTEPTQASQVSAPQQAMPVQPQQNPQTQQPLAAGQPTPLQGQPVPGAQSVDGPRTQPTQPMQMPVPGAVPGAAPGVVPGMAPVQPAAPSQSRVFFNWVLAALKKPTLRMAKPAWYACIPMFVEAMIISLLVTIWASQAVSAASRALGPWSSMMGGSIGSVSVSSSDGFALFFRGFIAVAVVLYAMVLIVFLGKKIFGDPDGFSQVHDAFAQIMIPFAVLHLVLVLLSLVGASLMAGVIFLFSFGFLMLIPSYLIATSANHRKLDSFWLWMISMVVAFLIFLLMMVIFASIAGAAFMSAMFGMR
ncbi:zinc ribbon domain-containing protein [Bifidobacterium xylocopae]|uniref:Zinc-ribbon domain-containing protein n=1 Tax=Bifidobacterium xylocopae TaxID=2493119 RepID=A0A366KD09_9BIFI|nr:zinc ribbon domain-containing protein [Bifidobacterium xylocopae]RBP99459.1 hypothetical protein CRD59_03565 [Bifidobacterium xylocopae]